MQLHPHFLFNTLNTISELVHENAEAADKMIARLSGLLRISLETSGLQEITLKRELDFLQKYLDIQEIRFAERLTVDIKIAPETYDALVPGMFLQPLVENAILYAVAPREAGGRIEIVSERKNNKLRLKIEDDGQNLKPNEKIVFREGVGIKNTRERLERLYGDAQTLDFSASAGGGLIVKIEIPFTENSNGGERQ
jgi:LytS/YehU family sensor histidine kinase